MVAALASWRQAHRASSSVGKSNGQGTLVEMQERTLRSLGNLEQQVSVIATSFEEHKTDHEAHHRETVHHRLETETV